VQYSFLLKSLKENERSQAQVGIDKSIVFRYNSTKLADLMRFLKIQNPKFKIQNKSQIQNPNLFRHLDLGF